MLKRLRNRFFRTSKPLSILVVCMENICRSPMAEGFIRQALEAEGLADQVEVASAGVLVSMPGSKPDPRAVKISDAYGVGISAIRARKVTEADFESYQFIYAVDAAVLALLLQRCPETLQQKVALLSASGEDIADPYYGNQVGFERVAEQIQCSMGYVTEEIKKASLRLPS